MNTEPEKVSIPRFLNIFKRFSAADKMKIADEIDRETFEARWIALDAELPDIAIPEDEIMNEIRAVRYAEKEDR
jgi:hypothetical protein